MIRKEKPEDAPGPGTQEVERGVSLPPKTCTWVDCTELAKHTNPGSSIALCDKHDEELNGKLKKVFIW